jgi:hypothetical protein
MSCNLSTFKLLFLTWWYTVFDFQPSTLQEMFCGFSHSPKANDTIPHKGVQPFPILQFITHYHSMLYNTPVNESSVINLRCPDFVEWNMIMGDTSSQAGLSNIVPCVIVTNNAVHAITTKLSFVQFITSYNTPVLQKIQVFWVTKVWHWTSWCLEEPQCLQRSVKKPLFTSNAAKCLPKDTGHNPIVL